MKSKSTTLKVIVFVVLAMLTCAYLLPIYVMVTNSLKTLPEITRRTYLALPSQLQTKNYTDALFGSRDFLITMGRPIINSTIITVAVTVLAAFFGGLGGYYLSRTKSTFTRVIFVLVGIALYMPYQAVIIPLTTITANRPCRWHYLQPPHRRSEGRQSRARPQSAGRHRRTGCVRVW